MLTGAHSDGIVLADFNFQVNKPTLTCYKNAKQKTNKYNKINITIKCMKFH